MSIRSQHKIPFQAAPYPRLRKPKEMPVLYVLQIPTGIVKADVRSDEVVVGLEKSDSFLQRLNAINSEIERQLKARAIR